MSVSGRYEGDLRELPLGSLAFIGDAVYELGMRTYVMQGHRQKPGALHHLSVKYVNAASQAKAFRALEHYVSETEYAWMKRGRNADPGTMAKNQDPVDYRQASGVETLFGFLYLSGNDERIAELLAFVITAMETDWEQTELKGQSGTAGRNKNG